MAKSKVSKHKPETNKKILLDVKEEYPTCIETEAHKKECSQTESIKQDNHAIFHEKPCRQDHDNVDSKIQVGTTVEEKMITSKTIFIEVKSGHSSGNSQNQVVRVCEEEVKKALEALIENVMIHARVREIDEIEFSQIQDGELTQYSLIESKIQGTHIPVEDAYVRLTKNYRVNLKRKGLSNFSNARRKKRCIMNKKDFLLLQTDVRRMASSVFDIKSFLPKLENGNSSFLKRLTDAEFEVRRVKTDNWRLNSELQHLRRRYDTVVADLESEREINARLENQMKELLQLNTQQSDYCSKLGTSTCTLLWKVTQIEDCVQSLLPSTRMSELLQLIWQTLESYISTYLDKDSVAPDEDSNQVHFVLALCGVLTNVAASASGREQLMLQPSSDHLIDVLVSLLLHLPQESKDLVKVVNICLMCLYNISINRKGFKAMSSNKELPVALARIVQGSAATDNKALATSILHSVLLDADNGEFLYRFLELVSTDQLRDLAAKSSGKLKEGLVKLATDIQLFQREQ